MVHQKSHLLIGTIAALATKSTLAAPSHRQALELGKFADGAETEIDCSTTTHDYAYYIERCFDEKTQWWINGHCINNVKTETSELHLCMRPNGERSNCFDCNDGNGRIKNVCGSDNPDETEVCELAWLGEAENCGDQGLTVYSHQCKAGSASDVDYLRESFNCEAEFVNTDPLRITCGEEWFYEFFSDEYPGMDIGDGHPFARAGNKFCLDCGMAIQVCAAGDGEATCESLGLPPRGSSVMPTAVVATTTVAATEPPMTDAPVTTTDAPVTMTAATEPAATTDAPNAATDATDATTTTDAPDDAMPTYKPTSPEDDDDTDKDDGGEDTEPASPADAAGATQPSSATLCSRSVVVAAAAIAGWTFSSFM